MKRIIIEAILPDGAEQYAKLVADIKRILPTTKYIAVEDVVEPSVISGYRDLRHRNPSP